jgi:hypothetical protein
LSQNGRVALLATVIGLMLCNLRAEAQENLDRSKTPAQLYVSDCAECHRNPKTVMKTVSPGSLVGYLREHYTASRESAAAIAGYLVSVAAPASAASPKSAAPSRVPGRAAPSAAKPPAASEAGKDKTATPAAKPNQADPAKPSEPAGEPKTPTAPEARPQTSADAPSPKPETLPPTGGGSN